MIKDKTRAILVLLAFVSLTGGESVGEWKELRLKSGQSLWASSELVEQRGEGVVTYSAKNIFDRKADTCWAEGVNGDGGGEGITIVVNNDIGSIGIINGNAKSAEIYKKNNRIKKLKCRLFVAFTAPGLVSETDSYLYVMKSSAPAFIELSDTDAMQYFELPAMLAEQRQFREMAMEEFIRDHPPFFEKIEEELGVSRDEPGEERRRFDNDFFFAYSIFGLVLEIAEVYPGSRYRDTCISEIEIEMVE